MKGGGAVPDQGSMQAEVLREGCCGLGKGF